MLVKSQRNRKKLKWDRQEKDHWKLKSPLKFLLTQNTKHLKSEKGLSASGIQVSISVTRNFIK